jgi:diguanylate cyclase (GGDEF)-like protein
MGQRIATTMDRAKLATVTASAFEAVTSASAVLLFENEGGELPRLKGVHGLSAEQAEELAPALLAELRELHAPCELDAPPAPFLSALAFPASDGGEVLGHAVVLYSSAPLDNVFVPAGYLARNYGMALRTLSRFAAVEDLAYIDDLTHLFNVRYLHLVVDREVHNFQQLGGVFSLLFLDLDRFKSVNDTHGHLVGSKLLVEVARVLRGCVRDNDVVARYGGDEYVVVLRNTDSKGAQRVAERIRRTLEEHRFLSREGLSLSLTTCVGVASFPEHAQDKATLLDMADRAMYRGKRGTRNGVYLAAEGLEAPPAERHSTKAG